jgi:hypothetical protein
MHLTRMASIALAVGVVTGAGATALGYELSDRSNSEHRCDSVHQQLRQVHATAVRQIGGGAAHASAVQEAAFVLAYPTCFSANQNIAAYDQMQAAVRVG